VTAAHADFVENCLQMVLQGIDRDAQSLGDGPCPQTGEHQRDDLAFARCQRVRSTHQPHYLLARGGAAENVWLDGASAVAQLTAPGRAAMVDGQPAHQESASDRPAPAFQQLYGKLPARDVNRARAFFAEKLGLRPFGERDGHLYYEVGGAYFIIFPSTGTPSGTHDQLGLVVDNLELEVTRLRASGVVFEEYPAPPGATIKDAIMHRSHIKAAWFKDTEGNLISIAEFTAGSPFVRLPLPTLAAAGTTE
jgi:catechol 2,3-dioxygenase-like lactoylglutathione lyase family enzyme